MFLVEYDGDWFCPNSVSDANKICPGEPPDPRTTGNTSQQAVTALVVHMYLQLVGHPSAKPGRPQLLRVGKARNDCIHGAAGCDTGVPPPTACPQFNSSPYCALTALKAYDVGLGVIMGSGQPGPPEEDGRPIRDMAWHACAVRRADRSGDGGRGLYDFMFLDEAKYLRGTVAEVVQRITAGRILDSNGDWVRCKDGANPFVGDPLDGWDVITNDNGWNLPKYSGYTLNTAAWGHATKYDRAFESEQQLRDVADGQAPLLTPGDFDFINRVNAVDTSSGQTFATRAIFRVEVPGYTSKLGTWLTPAQQCRFLERAARRQFQDGDTRHSFIIRSTCTADRSARRRPTTASTGAPSSSRCRGCTGTRARITIRDSRRRARARADASSEVGSPYEGADRDHAEEVRRAGSARDRLTIAPNESSSWLSRAIERSLRDASSWEMVQVLEAPFARHRVGSHGLAVEGDRVAARMNGFARMAALVVVAGVILGGCGGDEGVSAEEHNSALLEEAEGEARRGNGARRARRGA